MQLRKLLPLLQHPQPLPSLRGARAAMLAASATVLLCTGCVLAQPEPSTSQTAGQSSVQGQWQGVLTRKGPDLGAWWALTDSQGKTWRLEPSNPAQNQQLMVWQNRMVNVRGSSLPPMLATERIQLNEVVLSAEK